MTTNIIAAQSAPFTQQLIERGSIGIELVTGLLVFRISTKIQDRRETLIAQKTESSLTSEEETELDQYQQLVDYLNLVNETMRKAFLYPLQGRV